MESRRERITELLILTVPSLFILEVVSLFKENVLIQAHQLINLTRNRNNNPSIQHRQFKVIQIKTIVCKPKVFFEIVS